MGFAVAYGFYQRTRKHNGWTENFYQSAGTLASAMAKAEEFFPLLKKLHGKQTVFESTGCRQVGGGRLSRLKTYKPGSVTNPGAADSDFPTTAILLKLTDTTGAYVTRQWIKGIPDEVCNQGFYEPGTFDEKLQKVIKYLEDPTNGFQMYITLKPGDNPPQPIRGVSALGVITVPGHGYANGTKVRIGRVDGITSVNGVWKIMDRTEDTFKLEGYKALVDPGTWGSKGYVRKLAKQLVDIKTVENEGVSKHNVGRPSGGRSGKQKKKK